MSPLCMIRILLPSWKRKDIFHRKIVFPALGNMKDRVPHQHLLLKCP